MKLVKAFFRRITKDMKHKELLPLKVLFFVHASIFFVLYPYLTIHMRELGISVEEAAITSAVTPVVSIIMPPLSGMIADKIGNFKGLLAVFSSLGGVAALLLLLVPVGRVSITYPTTVDFSLSCQNMDSGVQRLSAAVAQYSCDPLHPYAYDIDMSIDTCGVSCYWPKDSVNVLQKAKTYIVKVRNSKDEITQVFRYPLEKENLLLSANEMTYQSSHRTLLNILDKTNVIKLSNNIFFFPMHQAYGLNCEQSDENEQYQCSFGTNGSLHTVEDKNWNQNYKLPMKLSPLSNKTESERVLDISGIDVAKLVRRFQVDGIAKATNNSDSHNYINATCVDHFKSLEISVELLYEEETINGTNIKILQSSETLTNCSSTCMGSTMRQNLCSNEKEQVDIDPSLTFWIYMSVRVLITILGGTAYAMFEGAVIAILREQEGDYGLQRIYGIIGGMISSPLSGLLIDWASEGKGYTDFRPAFYLYAVLKVFSGFLIMTINLDFKSPAPNILKDVVTVLKNVELVALFVASLILGSMWGFIESFLFWFLQDLGGTRGLMGITITIGGIAGIPLLVLSGPITEKLGHANIIFIGFLFYTVRLVGYSLIYNPWMCLIFEALEGVTSSLAFTAIVTYAARLSTTTTDSTVQGLLGGLYFGVGKGAGGLIGGYMLVLVGTRPTYQILAIVSSITGVIYFTFNKLYLLKRPQTEGNDICKKSKKNVNGERSKLNDKKPNLYSENINNELANVCTLNDDKEKIIYDRDAKQTATDICGVDNKAFNDDPRSAGAVNRAFEDVELSRVDDENNISKDGAASMRTSTK